MNPTPQFVAIWLLCVPLTLNAQSRTSIERSYGYLLGDLVVQDIQLPSDAASVLPASLPKPGYQTSWLYLRQATVQRSGGERRVRLIYQLMSAGSGVALIYLPTVQLSMVGGGKERIDAMPVTISPITAVNAVQRAGLGDLQPDRLPPVPDVAPAVSRLWFTVPLLALLTGLYSWRRTYLNRSGDSLPFNYASRQISGLARRGLARTGRQASAQHLTSAYRALHRAFDTTAGRGVFAEDVDGFVRDHPSFRDMRTDIDRFYTSSREVFFDATKATGAAGSLSLGELDALARRLSRTERSQA